MSSPPWTVNSEIYPLHLIGSANSLATCTNWLSNFILASFFLSSLESTKGEIIGFSLLALFSALSWIFVFFLIPETKNKPIVQILREILGENYKKTDSESNKNLED